MAFRVQSKDDINFGNAGAAVRVSHVRAREKDDSNPLVKELPQPIQIAAGAPMRIPAGLLDFLYLAGDMTNAHIGDAWYPWWGDAGKTGTGNKEMEVDLMTDENTAVAVAGYSQQPYKNWATSLEADPAE